MSLSVSQSILFIYMMRTTELLPEERINSTDSAASWVSWYYSESEVTTSNPTNDSRNPSNYRGSSVEPTGVTFTPIQCETRHLNHSSPSHPALPPPPLSQEQQEKGVHMFQ
jgi:hypothetical protein